eukprot:6933925-Prymnesium_polylepis.1
MHSPMKRSVTTYLKEVISEDDAKGFARKIVTYAKGVRETEEKVTLRTDVHFAYARNKGDARFHHTFQLPPGRLLVLQDGQGAECLRRVARWQGAAWLQELRQ